MSFEIVKIIDFVETLIFALRATLKKVLEESASHHDMLSMFIIHAASDQCMSEALLSDNLRRN